MRGHEEYDGKEDRDHLLVCTKWLQERPDIWRVYEDKMILEFKEWWRRHWYLGMGIPLSVKEDIEVKILYVKDEEGNFGVSSTKSRKGSSLMKYKNRKKKDCGKMIEDRFWGDVKGRWLMLEKPYGKEYVEGWESSKTALES
ncbi:hypothetical protein C7212DRAFT_346765 [Tuber magnatum]|uniref:Uncharacterized protein n=1 Tax=Tuber magnatum TaxID=42249 RepID=A0A317SI91_9PEZI|nr:hypothetical protein C7212DRAFT_346765 [Tuber magnatum]